MHPLQIVTFVKTLQIINKLTNNITGLYIQNLERLSALKKLNYSNLVRSKKAK